mmetsp:Transcript_13590/g.9775  ORF Transcript_13590/g.9775 Transcript_13590/m.9775 type:complete len:82 (+) Transcript_13590:284-529(+)
MVWPKPSATSMSFIDQVQRSSRALPPSNKYTEQLDWAKDLTNFQKGGSPMKGKFLKKKRVTSLEEVMLTSRKAKSPGPGQY